VGIVVRTPEDGEWESLCHADGRAFGFSYTAQQRDDRRPIIDLDRFRIACDGDDIVGVAGSYAFDVALPGGGSVPMAGITWVSVASTHRRQGLLRQLMAACLHDVAQRGEPLATLFASESGIYERFGYGLASWGRACRIDTPGVQLREDLRPPAGAVRFMDAGRAGVEVPALWERTWRDRPGEVRRSAAFHEAMRTIRSRPDGAESETFYLHHADGYAAYRMEERWRDGFPDHELRLTELVAATPEAHAALWHTLLGTDLVRTITTRGGLPLDDPLPYLVRGPRSIRTTSLHDAVWAHVLDPEVVFGARRYATDDRFVIEVTDGPLAARRYLIEGGPWGATCTAARVDPDLSLTHASLGALLYGGVRPSALAAGRRLEARGPEVLRRADLFFPWHVVPHCQTNY